MKIIDQHKPVIKQKIKSMGNRLVSKSYLNNDELIKYSDQKSPAKVAKRINFGPINASNEA